MDNRLKLLTSAIAFVLSASAFSANAAPVFSLDIGSDLEISDPARDAGELADPGDVYQSSQVAGSLLGSLPVLDEVLLQSHRLIALTLI